MTEQTGFLPTMSIEATLIEFYEWWVRQDDQAPTQYPREQQVLATVGLTS